MTVSGNNPRTAGRTPRVLIVGGGVAALEALLALDDLARSLVSLELMAPRPDFVYRPMRVIEPFEPAEAPRLRLADIAAAHRARHRVDALSGVDTDRRRISTSDGGSLDYDVLVIAMGARARSVLPGALDFADPESRRALERVLAETAAGVVEHLVFALPTGVSWPLPLYELAMLTARRLGSTEGCRPRITLVTPEPEPLAVFGPAAVAAVRLALAARGVAVRTGVAPTRVRYGTLELSDGDTVRADRTITLPCLKGPRIPGLPCDSDGFIRADHWGRVEGVEDVYVAGDASDYPIKQGGLAAQQADTVAQLIAAKAGARHSTQPSTPVLRAVLLTGGAPVYLRTRLDEPSRSEVADHPFWWPAGKIGGRYLSPYLASRLGQSTLTGTPPRAARAAHP